jgi:hypothetical protein
LSRFSANDPIQIDAAALLQRLRKRPWRELLDLPRHETVPLASDRKGTLSIWRDLLPGYTVRIVVQTYVPGRLGSAKVAADGFSVSMNGEVVDLPDEDLWAFT